MSDKHIIGNESEISTIRNCSSGASPAPPNPQTLVMNEGALGRQVTGVTWATLGDVGDARYRVH